MKNLFLLIVLIALLFLLNVSTYTVQETEQAIILQLGKMRGSPVTTAGLHWKIPFIQEVRFFEKRILHWDGTPGVVPTGDKKFILVDTTARWRINDALLFYRSVRDVENARFRMGSIIDGATKDTISSHPLIETVRNSNKIFEDIDENRRALKASESEFHEIAEVDTVLDRDVRKVVKGREELSKLIAQRAGQTLRDLGIELIDVQLRRIAYQEKVEKSVFDSMISEREQIATKIRSSGEGEKARVLGQLDLTLKRIESEAYRKAQETRGHADARAVRIFADALKQDTGFYEFVRNLEIYEKNLGKKANFILTTDNAFLHLLQKGA
ncbi:MAG: protease modulator HflC [Deltaproteobacteria bacterium]|nr:protease modulator HflC [Deltaproteobacteria bacterium]